MKPTGAAERRAGAGTRLALLVPLIALLAAAVTLWLDSDNGLRPLLGLAAEVESLEGRVAELEAERARLRADASGLRQDAFQIETTARESLGMIRPGERVVRLEDD